MLGDLECVTIVEDEIVSSTMLGSSQLLVTPPLRGMTSVASVGTCISVYKNRILNNKNKSLKIRRKPVRGSKIKRNVYWVFREGFGFYCYFVYIVRTFRVMYLYFYRHTVRCGQAVSVHCSNVCENILNCGQHHCAELCHGGQCQPCRIILNQSKWNAHVSNAQCIFLELCVMSIILQQNCFTEAYTRGKVWGMGIKNKLIVRCLSVLNQGF